MWYNYLTLWIKCINICKIYVTRKIESTNDKGLPLQNNAWLKVPHEVQDGLMDFKVTKY